MVFTSARDNSVMWSVSLKNCDAALFYRRHRFASAQEPEIPPPQPTPGEAPQPLPEIPPPATPQPEIPRPAEPQPELPHPGAPHPEVPQPDPPFPDGNPTRAFPGEFLDFTPLGLS